VAPLVTHLARSSLLRHEEVDVRLLVITCISEITRIAAPSFPYDDTTMEEVYELMIGSFQKLWDITNPHFDKRVKILKNMAKHSLHGNNILMFDKLLVPTNCIKLNMSAKGAGFQEDYEDGLVKRYAYEGRTSWNVYGNLQFVVIFRTTDPNGQLNEVCHPSMSLMDVPSHYPPSMNACGEDKGVLDKESSEELSVVPNSEILSFVDVGSSPRSDLIHVFRAVLVTDSRAYFVYIEVVDSSQAQRAGFEFIAAVLVDH
ncbi:hypothetical protein KI387_005293, partial [Taxus chinensis]